MCRKILLISCVTFFIWLSNSDTFCEGPNGPTCCNGFMWNTNTGKCIKCSLGFTGITCSLKCLYPNYGDNCQFHCNCAEEDCHYAFGCEDQSKDTWEPEIKTTDATIRPILTSSFFLSKTSEQGPTETMLPTYITPKETELYSISSISRSDIYISSKLSLFIVLFSACFLVVSISLIVIFMRKFGCCIRIVRRPKTNSELQEFVEQYRKPEQQTAQPKYVDTIYEEIPESTIENYLCHDNSLCEEHKTQSTDQEETSYIEPLSGQEAPTHCSSDSRLSYLTAVP